MKNKEYYFDIWTHWVWSYNYVYEVPLEHYPLKDDTEDMTDKEKINYDTKVQNPGVQIPMQQDNLPEMSLIQRTSTFCPLRLKYSYFLY